MNYYPEQLRRIAAMCEALNGLDDVPDAKVTFKNRIPVIDTEDRGEASPLGYLVDEIGGVWSFKPVGGTN